MRTYLTFCFSFLTAILLTNIYEQSSVYVFLLFLVIGLYILTWYKNLYPLIISGIIGISFGYLLSMQNISNINSNITYLNTATSGFSGTSNAEGKISGIEGTNEDKQYVLSLQKINGTEIKADMDILLRTSTINLSKGDIIKTTLKISEIKNSSDFDYKTYLKMKGIYGQANLGEFMKIGRQISTFDSKIEQVRSVLLKTIGKIYPDQYGALLSGILIGDKSGLSKEIKTSFNRSGLAHIIAVSGFNITILIIFLSFFVKYLPGYVRLAIISTSVVVFYLIVGENISALRASVMGIISYSAIVSFRKLENFNVLMSVIVVFVVLNPLILNYDISFHLSFLATLGILYSQGFFKKIFSRMPEFFSIRESLIMTSSALAFTIPIMLVNFGQLSIISPISNVIVAPAIPLSMLFGFLSIIFYYISNSVGIAIGFVGWLFLKFMIVVAAFSSSISWSVLEVNLFEYKYLFEIGYYVILVFLVIYFRENDTIKD